MLRAGGSSAIVATGGSEALPGCVGEVLSATFHQTNLPGGHSKFGTFGSIELSPGDWSVDGRVRTHTGAEGGNYNTLLARLDDSEPTSYRWAMDCDTAPLSCIWGTCGFAITKRFNVAVSTTVYLGYVAINTPQGDGAFDADCTIEARRMR